MSELVRQERVREVRERESETEREDYQNRPSMLADVSRWAVLPNEN